MAALLEPRYLDDIPLTRNVLNILDGYLHAPHHPSTTVQSLVSTILHIFNDGDNVLKIRYLWGVILNTVKQLSPDDDLQRHLVEVLLSI